MALIDGQRIATLKEKRYQSLLEELDAILNLNIPDDHETAISQSIMACHREGLFNEVELNTMGYEYLGKKKQTIKAEAILKTNTILYPESPNVYDSYGEALASNGKFNLAIENYQRAVELAEQMDHEDLELYIQGLERVQRMKADHD